MSADVYLPDQLDDLHADSGIEYATRMKNDSFLKLLFIIIHLDGKIEKRIKTSFPVLNKFNYVYNQQ